jgi:hypothetical protein
MITKTLIAAAAISMVAAVAATPAEAKVNVYLGLGGYGPGYYEPETIYVAPRRRHYEPVYEEDYYEPRPVRYGVSCDEGAQSVRNVGFRKVRPLDCNGNRFTYKARRHGSTYVVKVSRRSGDVISVQGY